MNSRQEFHGDVSQVVQAGTVHQVLHNHGRLLTSQERVELNNKVKRLTEEYNESGRATWKLVHRAIGIETIEHMRIGQLQSAHIILDLLLERDELQHKLSQQPLGEDAAQVAQQVRELTAKLRAALAENNRSERGRVEFAGRLADTEKALASLKASSGRAETVLGQLLQKNRQAEADGQFQRKKLSRLRSVAIMLGVLAAGSGFFAYQQLVRADYAEAWAGFCGLDGKSFAIGTLIDDKLDLQCVLESNGVAAWRRIPTKPKKPQH